jgi:DNA-binding NarL/FixJ family response regulator
MRANPQSFTEGGFMHRDDGASPAAGVRHEPDVVADLTSSLARAVLALARLASGDAVSCVEEIIDACGGPGLPALNSLDRAEAYEALVRAELARGRTAAAACWAQRAAVSVADSGLHGPTGFALLARAHSPLSRDPASAAQRALAAAEAFAKASRPLEEGRARLLAGITLATADRSQALDQLHRAKTLFADCGAHRLWERAVREQRWLGRRRGSHDGRAASTALPLSGRELEIAQLIAQGHTNRQIARKLRLSDKTIDTYLSRIFAKLGVSSRAVVAALITKDQSSA